MQHRLDPQCREVLFNSQNRRRDRSR